MLFTEEEHGHSGKPCWPSSNACMRRVQEGMGREIMPSTGEIKRSELIAWAVAQQEANTQKLDNINEQFTKVSSAAQAEELYAATRECAGTQRTLRAMLNQFDANVVVESPAGRVRNEESAGW